MAVNGATVAAVAGAAGVGTFQYNRANYKYDAEMRWERFSSMREYANQQAEQYRTDLRNLAALTVKKTTLWVTTATLCMALCVALYCAGRLGLHGPSPPTWIMGLWLTNNAAAFAFQAVAVFLCLHAGFRANAASVQLLTRKVRVPVPTLAQLDQARQFASEFEQQDWSDIFRIPYMNHNGAPKTDDLIFATDADEEMEDVNGRARSTPPARRHRDREPPAERRSKASSWVRKEFEQDRHRVLPAGEGAAKDETPEHFQLYQAAQKEFYQHDVYARICVFYGFIHFFQSLSYYGLGHINIELKAFWVAYGCVFVLAVLQALILRFDIIPSNPDKREILPRCEYLGPLAVLPAAIAMSLDFQVKFSLTAIAICWVFIFISYVLQFVYALRLLEIILPDQKFKGTGERLGASFLPEGWTDIPSAFQHVYYFVVPPQKLQPGQSDLVREVKDGGHGAYDEAVGNVGKTLDAYNSPVANDKVKTVPGMAEFAGNEHVKPWKVVAAIQAVLVGSWVFLIIGTIIDVAIGEQALVTAPHWSRPPMTRLSKSPFEAGAPLGFPWKAGARPFLPEQHAWHEEKKFVAEHNRRLAENAVLSAGRLSEAISNLFDAVPMTGDYHGTRVESVSWPSFFEPRLMACGPAQDARTSPVVALTQRGSGAVVQIGNEGSKSAEALRLAGVAHLPPLVGVSWTDEGLMLLSRAGHIVNCAGKPPAQGAAWRCSESEAVPSLPLPRGSRLLAASARRLDGNVLHAAFLHEHAPHVVAIYSQDSTGAWNPLGEIPVPRAQGRQTDNRKVSLSFADGSLYVSAGGKVFAHRLNDGELVHSSTYAHNDGNDWVAACSLEHGSTASVAHLRLRQAPAAHAQIPELVISQSTGKKPDIVA